MTEKTKKYTEAVGRRKTSVARVRLFSTAKHEITVNNRPFNQYFPTEELRQTALRPLLEVPGTKLAISARLSGGGLHSQAGALSHALARALVTINPANRPILKKALLLRRDARAKERRKFGLKKARKAPQWSKR